MSRSNEPQGGSIRITREEATSQHVDDMVRRSRSLRGEGGISADHGHGAWYYRNWFIFMIVGLVAAVIGWALIEPLMDDSFYIQGPIQSFDPDKTPMFTIDVDGTEVEVPVPLDLKGLLRVNNQDIYLYPGAYLHGVEGKQPVDPTSLKVGQEIGIYFPPSDWRSSDFAVAYMLDLSPAQAASSKDRLSLGDQSARHIQGSLLFFAIVAGVVGLMLGASDGIVCRLPRRALIGAGFGLMVGFIGGFLTGRVADLIYAPLSALAQEGQTTPDDVSTTGFLLQMVARGLGWMVAGLAMGIGQGIATLSKRTLLYGILGGLVGGLLGGLLFDPIYELLSSDQTVSAHYSRLVALAVIGATVGAMIGVVELLARDAWLRMTQGPLAGKEFLLFKDTMFLGSSPRSEIYLFNDEDVVEQHAVIRALGDDYEVETLYNERPVSINGRPVKRDRLHNGDKITIGRTMFVFQKRRGGR